jgi:hypothetical protein
MQSVDVLSVVMLNVVMLSVIMLIVVMKNVVAHPAVKIVQSLTKFKIKIFLKVN